MNVKLRRFLPWLLATQFAAAIAGALAMLGADPIERTLFGERLVLVEPRWLMLFAVAPWLWDRRVEADICDSLTMELVRLP